MSDSTRLVDLPPIQENVTYQMQMQQHPPLTNTIITTQHASSGLGNNNYTPLNVHPNPYGNQLDPAQDLTQPLQPPPMPNFIPPQQQRLPSRDIPISTNEYLHDEAVKANYIPTPSPESTIKVNNYIKEYDDMESKRIREHEITKYRHYWMEDTLRSYQIPFLIGVLFFIFQMNTVSRVLFLYLGKWRFFYQEDGNMSIYGMVFKSALFACSYWAIQFVLYNI